MEGRLDALTGMVAPSQFSPWLTSEQSWEELAENAKKARVGGIPPPGPFFMFL